jgi:hypothetical protein
MTKRHPSEATYCSYLWQHACVRSGLQLQPCCRFVIDSKDSLPRLHQNFDNITKTINSEFQQDIRAKALRGDIIDGCEKCRRTEQKGGFSLRNLANREFPRQGDEGLLSQPEDIRYLEIFTGSLCNLKCLTCGPDLSTTWQSEFHSLGWSFNKTESVDADYSRLISQTPNLRQIKFVGGEPFLSRSHDQILDAIPGPMAEKMKLVYYTNATIWPNAKVLGQWKRFARVELWLSIDGLGSVNDYVRFPSRWSDVLANMTKYFEFASENPVLKLGVNCTVSIYNVFSVRKLEEWMIQFRSHYSPDIFHMFHLNPLILPAHMDIQNMPEGLKSEVDLDLNSEQQRNVMDHMRRREANHQLLPLLVDFTKATDRHRKQNVCDVIPEIASIF